MFVHLPQLVETARTHIHIRVQNPRWPNFV